MIIKIFFPDGSNVKSRVDPAAAPVFMGQQLIFAGKKMDYNSRGKEQVELVAERVRTTLPYLATDEVNDKGEKS